MSDTLFDMTPYKSKAAHSYSPDWIDATGTDPSWDETELHKDNENSPALALEDVQDNSTLAPTMAEQEPTASSHASVEVVEELSPEEEADRIRLELLVERAFSQAGSGLRQLRDRRLYRSTHKTFEEYCQERFGFTRYAAYYKIAANDVLENLLTFSQQNSSTRNHQTLPTKETQVRPLAKLEPQEQYEVWRQAVETAGGKVPSSRIVKDAVLRHQGIVGQMREENSSPPEFILDDVVEIKAARGSPLRPFNGMWGLIEYVGNFSYTVRISIAKDTQQCKREEMTRIDDEYTADIKAVSQRIAFLASFELEPIEYDLLTNLQRSICFTPTQLQLLEWLELHHLTV